MISLLVLILVVILFFWALARLPMDAKTRTVIEVIVAVCILVWLLSFLFGYGVFPSHWSR
jgi:hypothetical protein